MHKFNNTKLQYCIPTIVFFLNTQIKLTQTGSSEYVIRTQPNEASLSTLESVAYTISWLEADPSVYDKLVQPMRMLCQYQLEYGAVVHHSKEHVNYKSRKLLVQSVNSTVWIVVSNFVFVYQERRCQ